MVMKKVAHGAPKKIPKPSMSKVEGFFAFGGIVLGLIGFCT